MKNTILLFTFFICAISFCCAQQEDKQAMKKETKEKIEALRKGYINDKLGLTEAEASIFWPIYTEYRLKEREIMEAMRPQQGKKLTMPDMTESEANDFIFNQMRMEEKKLALRKEYYTKLQKEISAKKLVRLKSAEKSFRAEVIRRIKDKRSKHKGERPHRPEGPR